MTVHLERQTECASVIVKCHSHQQSACSQDLQHKIYVTHNGTQTCSKSLLSEAIKHKHYPAPIMLKHLMQFQLPQTQGLLAPYLLPCLPFQILVCAESFVLMWTNKHLRLRVLSQGAEQCWVLLGMFPWISLEDVYWHQIHGSLILHGWIQEIPENRTRQTALLRGFNNKVSLLAIKGTHYMSQYEKEY